MDCIDPRHSGDNRESNGILQFQQAVHAGCLFGMGGRVRQLGSDGAGALGIDKGKQLHVFDLLDQIKRCLEILFRLAGEADNDVTGESYTGDFLLSIIDQIHILGNRIVAVHFFQDTVTAGLHR